MSTRATGQEKLHVVAVGIAKKCSKSVIAYRIHVATDIVFNCETSKELSVVLARHRPAVLEHEPLEPSKQLSFAHPSHHPTTVKRLALGIVKVVITTHLWMICFRRFLIQFLSEYGRCA